jgi:hypothetical protein
LKRIEHIRKVRTAPFQGKTATAVVTVLAHMARERQRLEQERGNWEKRIQRIEFRLKQLSAAEARLIPMVQLGAVSDAPPKKPALLAAGTRNPLPPGFKELTLQY